MERRLWLVGLNHRSAPVEVREAIALSLQETDELLQAASESPGIAEVFALSTCNRTELYGIGKVPRGVPDSLLRLLGTFKPLPPPRHFYTHGARDAARHLMAVTTGIDSMVQGEVQILGQVKEAYRQASAAGAIGPVLNRLLMGALHVGKRARAETRIGEGAVSVASAAVTLPLHIVGNLRDKTILIIGTGETGALAARHCHAHQPSRLLLANRTREKAIALADELGASTVPFDAIDDTLPEADVVISAVRTPSILLTESGLRKAMAKRRHRLMVIVDISVPRSVDPAAERIANIFAYSIDALQRLVDKNLDRRRQEIPKVESIIDSAVDAFLLWIHGLAVKPVTTSLRERFEETCRDELARRINRFAAEDRPQAEALARGIVNKLLHQPTIALKQWDAENPETLRRLDTIRQLFGLHDESKT